METITLDVGGQIFKTDHHTIIKIPYFKDMFDGCGNVPETIFVNRPGHTFKHVIAWMMDSKYPYPKKYAFELDFYGIIYDRTKLYVSQQEIMEKQYDIMFGNDQIIDRQVKQQMEMAELKNILNSHSEVLNAIKPRKTCTYTNCTVKIDDPYNWCGIHYIYNSGCNRVGCKQIRITGSHFCMQHLH
jgi:hypothetical protein